MSKTANVLWFIFFGFWIAIEYFLIGIFSCMTIIFIPFGLQYFKLGQLVIRPFGKEVVREHDTKYLILNILWAIFGGFVFSLGLFLTGAILCATVVGIPLGMQVFKLGKMAIAPFGAQFKEIQKKSKGNGSVNLLNSENTNHVNLLNQSNGNNINLLSEIDSNEGAIENVHVKKLDTKSQFEEELACDPISRLEFAVGFLRLFKKKHRENVFYALSVCSDTEYKKIRTEYFRRGVILLTIIITVALYSFSFGLAQLIYSATEIGWMRLYFNDLNVWYGIFLPVDIVFFLMVGVFISDIYKRKNYKKFLSLLKIDDIELKSMRISDQTSIKKDRTTEKLYETSKYIIRTNSFSKKSSKNIFYFNEIINYRVQNQKYTIKYLSKNKKSVFKKRYNPGLFLYTDIPFAKIFYLKKYKICQNTLKKEV